MADLINKIFPVTDEDVKKVLAIYGKEKKDVEKDVNIIKTWLKQQPHLPQDEDDSRLERFLLRNKFRLQQTKLKLEAYYTMKGLHGDYLQIMLDPYLMEKTRKAIYWSPMPKLTTRMERVFVFRYGKNDLLYDLKTAMCYLMAVLEIELSYDYSVGVAMVWDMQQCTTNHYKTMTPNIFAESVNLHQEAYSGRMSSVNIVYAPAFMNLLLTMFKIIFKPKFFSKIIIHENLDSLYKIIPKECLPVDLGGELIKSTEEIHEDVGEMMIANKEFISKHVQRVANESLRVGEVVPSDIFGIEGSFKQINID